MTLTFFVLMGLIAVILGAWWALVDAVASGNWYQRGTTPSDEPTIMINSQSFTQSELETLAQLGATYQPLSFQRPAVKGFVRKQGVSAGTKTPPTTPAA